jgi:hypothetical protein
MIVACAPFGVRRGLGHRLVLPKRRRCARRKRSRSSACASRSGETSWHGFTCAIVEGLRARGVALAVEQIIPIPHRRISDSAQAAAHSRLISIVCARSSA